MELSLAGRFLVYARRRGLRRLKRLPDGERERLRDLVKTLTPKGGGVIARTAARARPRGARARPAVPAQAVGASTPAPRRRQAPAWCTRRPTSSLRMIRDLLSRNVDEVMVDDERQYRRILGFVRTTRPSSPTASSCTRRQPLLRRYGVEAALRSTLQPPRRPAVGRLPAVRLRRGVHDHRRQHRPLRRQVGRLEDTITREQPRGGPRGGAPAAAARHRRHHRHRLHRHGAAEEPRRRDRGAPGRADEGPHQDLPGRDLAAGPGRDDPPERHRRRPRDHDRGSARRAAARAACSPRRRWRSRTSAAAPARALVQPGGVPGRAEPRGRGEMVGPGGSRCPSWSARPASTSRWWRD